MTDVDVKQLSDDPEQQEYLLHLVRDCELTNRPPILFSWDPEYLANFCTQVDALRALDGDPAPPAWVPPAPLTAQVFAKAVLVQAMALGQPGTAYHPRQGVQVRIHSSSARSGSGHSMHCFEFRSRHDCAG